MKSCGTCEYFKTIPMKKCCVNPPQAAVVGLAPQGPQIVTFWPSPTEGDLCEKWAPDANNLES